MCGCDKQTTPEFWAVTKSGTGTWDMGCKDSGMPGHGTRGYGT